MHYFINYILHVLILEVGEWDSYAAAYSYLILEHAHIQWHWQIHVTAILMIVFTE